MAVRAPRGLGAEGRGLWRAVAGSDSYNLRPDELCLLAEACAEADLIGRMRAELDGAGLVTEGSQGQPVANPLIAEVRQHRLLLARLLSQLGLPDGADAASADDELRRARSRLGRQGARARWS
jgi:hypothetical protein